MEPDHLRCILCPYKIYDYNIIWLHFLFIDNTDTSKLGKFICFLSRFVWALIIPSERNIELLTQCGIFRIASSAKWGQQQTSGKTTTIITKSWEICFALLCFAFTHKREQKSHKNTNRDRNVVLPLYCSSSSHSLSFQAQKITKINAPARSKLNSIKVDTVDE